MVVAVMVATLVSAAVLVAMTDVVAKKITAAIKRLAIGM